MPETPLHSIASIAKRLDLPESTLHYWKNRFEPFLPAQGQGRGRRFRPEALEVFRAIADLLGSGMAVPDVKAELARRRAPGADAPAAVEPQVARREASGGEELALRIGTAMAEAMGQRLSVWLAAAAPRPAPDAQEVQALRQELARARGEIEALRELGEAGAEKFRVLEAELVRLRKDSRALEKHLLEKIRGVKP